MTVGNEALAGGVDRAEDRHSGPNGRIAYARWELLAAWGSRAIRALSFLRLLLLGLDPLPPGLLPPKGVAEPAVLPDVADLDRADIAVEIRAHGRLDKLQSFADDLPGLDPLPLKDDVVLRDLAEGAVENRYFVLKAEPQVRVLVEPLTQRRLLRVWSCPLPQGERAQIRPPRSLLGRSQQGSFSISGRRARGRATPCNPSFLV
jgi:hypothetical protein